MGKLMMLLWQRLMISNKHRTVRQSIIFIMVNILLLGGIIFVLEIVLIFLGVGDVFIPWTHNILNYLRSL